MTVVSFIKEKIIDPVIAFFKGKNVEAFIPSFVITDTQTFIASLKHTDIGTKVAALIEDASALKDADGNAISGSEKMVKVVADVIPIISDFLTKQGVTNVLETQVKGLALELAQSIYNDAKNEGAAAIAIQILQAASKK